MILLQTESVEYGGDLYSVAIMPNNEVHYAAKQIIGEIWCEWLDTFTHEDFDNMSKIGMNRDSLAVFRDYMTESYVVKYNDTIYYAPKRQFRIKEQKLS